MSRQAHTFRRSEPSAGQVNPRRHITWGLFQSIPGAASSRRHILWGFPWSWPTIQGTPQKCADIVPTGIGADKGIAGARQRPPNGDIRVVIEPRGIAMNPDNTGRQRRRRLVGRPYPEPFQQEPVLAAGIEDLLGNRLHLLQLLSCRVVTLAASSNILRSTSLLKMCCTILQAGVGLTDQRLAASSTILAGPASTYNSIGLLIDNLTL